MITDPEITELGSKIQSFVMFIVGQPEMLKPGVRIRSYGK